MRYILTFAAAVLAAPAFAQDVPFLPEATELCLATAQDPVATEACIGTSAQLCIDTPGSYSTVGMGFCYSAEAGYWETRLNSAFAALMTVERALVDEIAGSGGVAPDTPAALRNMQRAWIGYRDATCAYEYATWAGGTGGGPAHAACLMVETGRQALILEDRLADRAQ